MELSEIRNGVVHLTAGINQLKEVVSYLEVAVARGDPRFCRAEFATADFDCDAFDEWWRGRGRRVPTREEIGC